MKKVFYGVLSAVAITTLLAGCTTSTPNLTAPTLTQAPSIAVVVTDAPPPKPTQIATPVPEKIYKVGEIGTLNQVEITVNKVTRNKGSQFNAPKDGSEFVIINVTVKNTRDSIIDYNPIYFQMINSEGQIKDISFLATFNSKDQLDYGSLVSNGKVSGTLGFEEPINDALQLLYQSSTGEVIKFAI